MTRPRPRSRASIRFQDFFAERRWWQLLAVPFTIGTVSLYRGRYLLAGGVVTAWVLASVLMAGCLAMLIYPGRPYWQRTVLLLVISTSGSLLQATIPPSWTIALPFLVTFVVVRRYPRRPATVVVTGSVLVLVLNQLISGAHFIGAIASLAVLSTMIMGATARRGREDRLEQAELALAREQAAREEHARAAALAERTRIAREIHDVLAHSLSALSLNLQGARLMLAKENASEQAQEQVRRAQRLAAEGLAEARRAVAALRDDPVRAARAIADLVTSSRLESGTPTGFTLVGTPDDLPGPAEDALFRTAQEALSNSRKHAPGAPVDVVLAYQPDRAELTVTDHQGHAPANPPAGGYGLTGMRERAELIGAELATGPTEDGWRVRLVVPR